METIMEDEDYEWREVKLPSLIPKVQEPVELERETAERRRGRDVLIAIDHGPNSKHALDWALPHLCCLADTIHLVCAVSSTLSLSLSLSASAASIYGRKLVKTKDHIAEGDAGKVICKYAERLKPVTVVMGTRGSVIQGSVSEYCFHNCKSAPVIIVPGKGHHARGVMGWANILGLINRQIALKSETCRLQ
ncbi:UspA, partial [Dillenia turbinata]